jgi:putative membrane protein
MAVAQPAPAAVNSTATAPSNMGLTDPNIVYILDQANAADSARGTLAATRGSSTDVKNFGKLMMGEHHALRAEGQRLAAKLGVTPQAPAGDQSQAQAKRELDGLTAMPKGAAWDKAYIDYEVTYHKAVIEVANKALGVTQNAQLKALIKQAAPVLQHHLDRAEQIQKKQGM